MSNSRVAENVNYLLIGLNCALIIWSSYIITYHRIKCTPLIVMLVLYLAGICIVFYCGIVVVFIFPYFVNNTYVTFVIWFCKDTNQSINLYLFIWPLALNTPFICIFEMFFTLTSPSIILSLEQAVTTRQTNLLSTYLFSSTFVSSWSWYQWLHAVWYLFICFNVFFNVFEYSQIYETFLQFPNQCS